MLCKLAACLPESMCSKVVPILIAFLYQICISSGQRQWVPPTTTAAEMWNPYTWYWPYAIAASEGYRDYFQNAQQITNQLYMQAYNTNAFWWTNNRPGGQAGQVAGGAAGQAGQAAGGAAGQAGGAAGQAGQATGQATGQGGQATGQGGQATGQATGQGGQAAGQAGQAGQGTAGQGTGGATQGGNRPVANMAQGGNGWS